MSTLCIFWSSLLYFPLSLFTSVSFPEFIFLKSNKLAIVSTSSGKNKIKQNGRVEQRPIIKSLLLISYLTTTHHSAHLHGTQCSIVLFSSLKSSAWMYRFERNLRLTFCCSSSDIFTRSSPWNRNEHGMAWRWPPTRLWIFDCSPPTRPPMFNSLLFSIF